ncbi:transposase [Paenibacillus sp. 19GGS1-52]|uniref:transposase n=1 Tax=Paenibacillus sp. 19GGS1-52 TaxID=2758563 RepID=UPI001EFABB41|nr:transposase [Paenibacillus sp. 19GGS1-52]ULO06504.1 transposase [Paenibacillus sp. 19GGS1-52]
MTSDADLQEVSLDSTSCKVHLYLTSGNIHDCTVATHVLSGLALSGAAVLADKAYGTLNIRTYIESQNATFCIPPKSNATDPLACDFYHYKERHVVECYFNKLKQFRGIATRYDKLSRNFLSFAFLASMMILLK